MIIEGTFKGNKRKKKYSFNIKYYLFYAPLFIPVVIYGICLSISAVVHEQPVCAHCSSTCRWMLILLSCFPKRKPKIERHMKKERQGKRQEGTSELGKHQCSYSAAAGLIGKAL